MVDITCSYCDTFQNCRSDLRKMTKIQVSEKINKLVSERYCRYTKKYVFSDDHGCDKLEKGDYFWCNNWNCWVHFPVCLSRQHKKKSCTTRCSQKRIILALSRIDPLFGLRSTHKPVKLDGKVKRRKL